MGGKGSVLMGFGKIYANEPFRRQMGNKEKHLWLKLCFAHHPGAGHRLPSMASFCKCSLANIWLWFWSLSKCEKGHTLD